MPWNAGLERRGWVTQVSRLDAQGGCDSRARLECGNGRRRRDIITAARVELFKSVARAVIPHSYLPLYPVCLGKKSCLLPWAHEQNRVPLGAQLPMFANANVSGTKIQILGQC